MRRVDLRIAVTGVFAAIVFLFFPAAATATVSFVEDPQGGPITIGGFGFSADPAFAPPSAEEAHAIGTYSNCPAYLDSNTDIFGGTPETIGGVPYVSRTLYWTDPSNANLISDWLTVEASVVSSCTEASTIKIGFHSLEPGDPQPTFTGAVDNQGSETGIATSFTNYFEDPDDSSFLEADVGGISISVTSLADAVPEPLTLSLLGAGLVGLIAMQQRKRRDLI